MNEDFLQFVWEQQLFEVPLGLIDGQAVEVLSVGQRNVSSGPDFFNARIMVGQTEWVGTVEIHLRSSDWKRHGHRTDKAYNNVVLQLVGEDDAETTDATGRRVPTLQLRPQKRVEANYQQLLGAQTWVPCQAKLPLVDAFSVAFWLSKVAVERAEQKANKLNGAFEACQRNWEEMFYRQLAVGLGANHNALPFELLTQSLPLSVLLKHRDKLHHLEAMLYGVAGLLDGSDCADAYYVQLRRDFAFFKSKFGLTAIDVSLWKFMRLRPPNFPTIRLAQLAQLIHQSQGLFSKVIDAPDPDKLVTLFEVPVSDYWETHYTFGKESVRRKKSLGKSTVHSLVINVVVPTLFLCAKIKGEADLQDKAINLLELLPPEKNSTVDRWRHLGVALTTAVDSQAVLHLKKHYCDAGRCLHCEIGNKLLRC